MSNIALELLRNTSAGWSNTSRILKLGEFAIETDTNFVKVGDGVNTYENTAYAGFIPSSKGSTGTTGST